MHLGAKLAFIASLAIAPLALHLALPAACSAAEKEKKKAKKGAATKAKTNGKDAKTAVKEVERERVEPEKKAEPPRTGPVTSTPPGEVRGPTRIDFDDRLIQGQTNKSGAVYLFDRKETGISSMVRRRKSFRQLTLQTIYDR